MNKFEFLKSLGEADDETLMLSRKDCHAANVSSIVYGQTPSGNLQRAFFAWPGHELGENTLEGKMPVGIHDHRYLIALTLICGEVTNTNYEIAYEGVELNKFKFSTFFGGGGAKLIGKVSVKKQSELSLVHSKWLVLPHQQLHNITCSKMAAWAVFESQPEKDVTTLLSKADTIEPEGLYKPFNSPQDVKSHVNEFFKLFEGRA